MKKLLAILLAAPLLAQSPLVTLSESAYPSAVGGGLFRGKISFELPAVCRLSLAGQAFARTRARLCVGVTNTECTSTFAAGVFSIGLLPTSAASATTPAGCYYNVRFEPVLGDAYNETLDIPPTGPVHLGTPGVRVSVLPTPTTRIRVSQIDWEGLSGCFQISQNAVVGINCGTGGSGLGTPWDSLISGWDSYTSAWDAT